jgi:hypothetical protein
MLLAASLVLVAAGFPGHAGAQDADVDPPARVGRLSALNGQVWLYIPGTGEWASAGLNHPLTSGDRVATDPGARAEFEVGSTTVRIDGSSEVELAGVDDEHLELVLLDGSAIADVRDASVAGPLDWTTDEGRFVTLRDGSYRLDRSDGKSRLTVYSGQARYEGPNSALAVDAGQRAEFWIDSGGVAQYSLLAPVNDAFLAWSRARDRRGNVAERYVSPEMTGAADLDEYGRWEQSPDDGPVWIPTTVAVDWAPYSQGHWTWVRPWGWTWVDDAPWGFAPFHYGRWVYFRSRWCWTPGARVVRPVYAPALVAWVGGPGGGVSVSVGTGPAVGWLPLAPREVYVPGYRVSPRYARDLNIADVANAARIVRVFNNPRAPRVFENRHHPRAITVVPANVMTERRPVAPAAVPFRQAPWVREIANDRGRIAPVLAPSVSLPPMPARRPDPRAIQPPPGVRADDGGRRRPGERPAPAPRGREDTERDRTTMPGRLPDRPAFEPDRRPPVAPVGQPGAARTLPAPVLPPRPPAPSVIKPMPASERPPGQPGPTMHVLPVRRGGEPRLEYRGDAPRFEPPRPPARAPAPVAQRPAPPRVERTAPPRPAAPAPREAARPLAPRAPPAETRGADRQQLPPGAPGEAR